MKKTGSSWGDCKYRKLQPWQRAVWRYFCNKTCNWCDPDYCLGPDEDNDSKGEPDEEQLDQ